MPLSVKQYNLEFIKYNNEELRKNVEKRMELLREVGTQINYKEEIVKGDYDRVNLQTKEFVERFNLDFRLFDKDRKKYEN